MAYLTANPKVLEWARTEAQLTQAEAADELGIDVEELRAYESGRKLPLGVVRQMSAKYGLSVAALAMPEPFQPVPLPKDFRTIDGQPKKITRKTAIAIKLARYYNAQMRDLMDLDTDFAIHYSVPNAEPGESANFLAARERERLKITIDDQTHWSSDSFAFRVWRERLEKLGINVFVLDIPVADCRGFSLRESDCPVIVVSKNEHTEGAKIFTLLHEYCHILRNEPGISDLNQNNRVERFCNEFAAHILMPQEALKVALGIPDNPQIIDWDFDQIRLAARRLRVSQQALALRLDNAGYSQGLYESVRTRQEKVATAKKKKPKTPPKIPATVRRLQEVGPTYANIALQSYDRGNINAVEITRALHLSHLHLNDMRNRLTPGLARHGPELRSIS